jgi:hypothetical protein
MAADAPDVDVVRDFFLDQLKLYYGGAVAARVWSHAGAIRAVRAEPALTYTGKVLPLALIGREEKTQ